jgi:RNAse (barnase) inhibitor barstar
MADLTDTSAYRDFAMKHLQLDATNWRSADDFYDALLAALGAPDWHGHNLDALWDSIVTGSINEVEPPFAIEVLGRPVGESAARELQRFVDLIQEARAKGVPVTIEVPTLG